MTPLITSLIWIEIRSLPTDDRRVTHTLEELLVIRVIDTVVILPDRTDMAAAEEEEESIILLLEVVLVLVIAGTVTRLRIEEKTVIEIDDNPLHPAMVIDISPWASIYLSLRVGMIYHRILHQSSIDAHYLSFYILANIPFIHSSIYLNSIEHFPTPVQCLVHHQYKPNRRHIFSSDELNHGLNEP